MVLHLVTKSVTFRNMVTQASNMPTLNHGQKLMFTVTQVTMLKCQVKFYLGYDGNFSNYEKAIRHDEKISKNEKA